ncbi:Autophagy-related protein 3 [Arabidopsis thaliana x Arabidopsis arenosa]|uniref:Autophagy-related protein 3 n=1 Tax=Arabidopsis thaliana x Arabidopsis arenosa TaxID=1240361 RepID=A0A8T1YE23_9BRAS|nr:Autophagy-related protein 3 [Arabidopsis thaliana x Arabidopsis arenosa]
MVLSQKLHEAFKGTVERMTGPRTISVFKEKGARVSIAARCSSQLKDRYLLFMFLSLTPWLFLLTRESGDPYLPSDKQFLITRNVPCLRRDASVVEEYEAAGGEVLVDDEDNDGWLATHGKPKDKGNEDENLSSMDVLDINERNAIQSIPTYFGGEEDDDIPDMEEFDEADNVVENDPCRQTNNSSLWFRYDKYYQTPRVWLTGYDESRMLLQPELVMEDVSQDHSRKTFHPCRHGAVMKKIIDVLMSRGVEPEVDNFVCKWKVLKWEDVEVGEPKEGVYKPASMPFTPGMEPVGEVVAVGSGLTGRKIGDLVAYARNPMGAYAEEQILPADKVVYVPSSIDPIVAASVMLKGMTAQFLLRRCFKVERGHTILVHDAAGGVGSLLCQWANALGATVIGTVSTNEKAAQAKEDGCHHVIMYKDEDFVSRVNDLTSGKGVNVVYDSVGKDTFKGSLACLKN